jgi:predicted transcriptional regulator
MTDELRDVLDKNLDDAATALQTARERVAAARSNLVVKRKAQADAIMNWMAEFPNRFRTTADLVRDNSRREIERKMAVLRGEIAEEIVEPIRPPSHLDAVLMSGGRGGSCDYGFRRPRARLPSQR